MALSDAQKAALGRWGLTVDTKPEAQPAWFEVTHSGMSATVGQFVGWHGSTRPISRVEVSASGHVRFSIPPQFERGDGDLVLDGKIDGDSISGTILTPSGEAVTFTGKRAPALRHATPEWGEPITLFNGTDLSGWHVIQGESQWVAEDGILRNLKPGGNIVTDQKFGDFKLHLEYRLAAGGNSGIYLRGRYEVQVLDTPMQDPDSHLVGGVYGFLTPSEIVSNAPGQWMSYDITLIGRMITVTLNGVTIITNQAIPGITGGALDSDEGAPGPLMLQGDHTAADYRNIVITPAK